MASPRQLAANRANARRSTGPRSTRGKARSRLNAFRHGLAVSVYADAALSEEVERLARRIADRHPTLLHLARAIAEAEVDLRRVRRIRSQLINRVIAHGGCEGTNEELLSVLERYIRENAVGRTRRKREERLDRFFKGRALPSEELPALADWIREMDRMHTVQDRARRDLVHIETKSSEELEAWMLRALSEELARMDRYERRALSRRRFAVREFDAARKERRS